MTKYFGKVYQEPWLKSNGNSTCASGTSTLPWPCARVLSHGDQAVHVSTLVRPCRVQYSQAPFFTEAILPNLVPGHRLADISVGEVHPMAQAWVRPPGWPRACSPEYAHHMMALVHARPGMSA